MDLPKCCNKKCFNISGFYLEKKSKYACHSWAQLKFLKDQKVLLIDPKVPNDTLTGLSQCIKLFSQTVNEDDDEDTMEEAKTLIAKLDEEISQLSSKLVKSSSDGAYHHFMSIQEGAQALFDSLKKENLYIEFATKFVFDQTLHQCSGKEHSSQSHKIPQPQVVNTPMHAVQDAWGEGTPSCNNQSIGQIKERLEKLTEDINNLDPSLGQHKTATLTVINSMKALLKHFEGLHEKRINQLKDYDELYKTEIDQKDKLIKILQEDAKKESEELKEEIAKYKKIVETLKAKEAPIELEYDKLEEQNWEKIPLPDIDIYPKGELKSLYKETFGYEIEAKKESDIILDLNDDSHVNLVTLAKKRFPTINSVKMMRILKVKQGVLKNFLKNCLPLKFNMLHFGFKTRCQRDFSPYFKEIIMIRNWVTKHLEIWDFIFSHLQIIKLFGAYKHVENLSLNWSYLEICSPPNFEEKLKNTNINYLQLNNIGYCMWNDWQLDPSPFVNLIKGLSTSEDFKNSLKSMRIPQCGLTEERYREILDENGFDNVSLSLQAIY